MKVRLKIQLLDKMQSQPAFISQPNYVDLVKLVRSLQRAEGNLDCYRRGRQQCDRIDCAWRDHCLEAPEGQDFDSQPSGSPSKTTMADDAGI
jgi:hypothetical protein